MAACSAHAHKRLGGEVDACAFVAVGAVVVAGDGVALEDRDERQMGREVLEVQEVRDGPVLVCADGGAGAVQYLVLDHPVQRRGPGELADFVGVAVDCGDVGVAADGPSAVEGEFGEASGVQGPRPGRAGKRAAAGESPVRDE